MEWYAVKIVISINRTTDPIKTNADFNEDSFYEESIRVVKANSFDDASAKVEKIAQKLCDTYINIYGQTVCEQVYGVIEVYKLDELEDGEEIFSSHFKVSPDQDIESVLDARYDSCTEKDMRVLRNIEFNTPI